MVEAPETSQVTESLDDGMRDLVAELRNQSVSQICQRTRMVDAEIRVFKSEIPRLDHEIFAGRNAMVDNEEKVAVNSQLPHLIGSISEVLTLDDEVAEKPSRDSSGMKSSSIKLSKSVIVNTTTRQTVFLPLAGLVPTEELKPDDLVGLNKDSYLVLHKLPPDFDCRVKAMEVDEKPTDQYSDIGGCDKQIQELIEAIVLPMTHKERFEKIGITPPKGVLLHGPPGTGKTMLARACAAASNATFLKLAGTQLVQMFIGDGAKLVRDAFLLGKQKAPTIIFIDEIDAVGGKRGMGAEHSGVREVQRTMLELLNQLDGFSKDTNVKIILATNRPGALDPALLRSGRIDRKIELPAPNEEARAKILQIHARKMNINNKDVSFTELARATHDMNGAQLKAVCVEAGMGALRRGALELNHEDFMNGVIEVLSKKKSSLNYYA